MTPPNFVQDIIRDIPRNVVQSPSSRVRPDDWSFCDFPSHQLYLCDRADKAYKAAKAVLSDTWLKSTRTPNRFISLTSSFPRFLSLSISQCRGVQLTRDRSIWVLEVQIYPPSRRIRCYSHELGSYIGHRACGIFVELPSISLSEPESVEHTSKGITKGMSTSISPETT